jgi:hypothetical protein
MELSLDKLRSVVPAIIAVVTTVSSLFMAGKHYLDSEFVNVSDFDRTRLNMAINLLDNRKLTLETRLYVYKLCKISPQCIANNKNIDADIERDTREIDDVRGHLETLKKKLFN